MSKEKKLDRLYISRASLPDYDKLKEKYSPYSGKQNKDLFLAAIATGFHEGMRVEVKPPRDGIIFEDYLSDSERKLLNALAIYEEKNIEVLLDKEKVFRIAEEYAEGGIKILVNRIFSGDFGSYSKKMGNDLLDKFNEVLKPLYTTPTDSFDMENIDIEKLVTKNESEILEFKASMLWDYEKKERNNVLSAVIAKTISSFMNSSGGILLIGLSDKNQILGLENDLSILKDLDGFERHLTNIINKHLGKIYRQFVNIEFKNIQDKTLAVVKIRKATGPVHFTNQDKPEFYIRAGNTCQPLDMREATFYIRDNWSS